MYPLILVVTFLTFRTADVLYRYAVHFTIFYIRMEFFVNAVEFISCTVAVKINLGFPVTIDTPAHA